MAIGEVIKTEEHGGKPSLTIKWDQKPQGWGYKSISDYGDKRAIAISAVINQMRNGR
jgi:hypothetical protein